MGLHVAGQLGRGLAGHAASLHRMQSARGESPGSCTTWMCRFAAVSESFVAELTDQVRALAVHLQVGRKYKLSSTSCHTHDMGPSAHVLLCGLADNPS